MFPQSGSKYLSTKQANFQIWTLLTSKKQWRWWLKWHIWGFKIVVNKPVGEVTADKSTFTKVCNGKKRHFMKIPKCTWEEKRKQNINLTICNLTCCKTWWAKEEWCEVMKSSWTANKLAFVILCDLFGISAHLFVVLFVARITQKVEATGNDGNSVMKW